MLEGTARGQQRERASVFVFVRLHAREGQEHDVIAALERVAAPTREEPGCVAFNGFRSVRDPRLFYIHSAWADHAAFDRHAELPHTVEFIRLVDTLLDEPRAVARTLAIV
jgi:quinol monooxygenase YgiN